MSDDSQSHHKISKSLKQALEKKDWSLEEAAWILAGLSNLDNPMTLRRLADDEEVIFGTPEYGYAKAEQQKIYVILEEKIYRALSVRTHLATVYDEDDPKSSRYKPLRILDQVTRGFYMTERIDIPWLKIAFDYGLIPGDLVGRPGVQKINSGKISATTTATATANAEVVKPKKLFHVITQYDFENAFHEWIYNQLINLSEAGKKRPSAKKGMLEIIKEKRPAHIIKIESDSLIHYWDDDGKVKRVMTLDALKTLIYTYAPTPNPKRKKKRKISF